MLKVLLQFLLWFGEQIVSFLLGVGFGKFQPFWSGRKRKIDLDNVLKLNDNDTKLIVPIRAGELDDDFATKLAWNKYVTLEESLIFIELQKMLEETKGNEFQLVASMINPKEIAPNDNVICIGGPMASRTVAGFFHNGDLLDRIKFRWTRRDEKERMKNYSDFIYLADEEIIDGIIVRDNEIKINNKVFRYDLHNTIERREGYIFLARLVGENDFNDKEHGTIHIIFGNNAECTLAAFKVLITQRKALINKIKENKRFGHYVFLIKCRMTVTGAEANFNEFYDFTDECFRKETIQE